jgi:hypothetical protein
MGEADCCSLRRRSILFSEVLVFALLSVTIVSCVKATGKEKLILKKGVDDTSATGVRAAGEDDTHHHPRAAVGVHLKFLSY